MRNSPKQREAARKVGALGKGRGKGVFITDKGYVRVSRVGPTRGKYVHRIVMAEMCKEFCFYPLLDDGIPSGMTVEHLDHKKVHNCGGNLLLLDITIHNHISWASWLNRDKMGPPPSKSYLPGPDDQDETTIRYTQEERSEVPW